MSDGASAAPVDGDGLHRLHHPNRSSHTRIHAHNSHAKESQPLVQPRKYSASSSSSLAASHNSVSTNGGPPSHTDGSSGVGSGTGTQGGAISQGRSRAASRASSVARSRAASAAAAALSRLGTPVGSAFNLVISAAGAGLLSYPFAMRSQGWLLNIILTVSFAFVNVYTLRILVHFTQRYRPDLRMQTYEELMQHALGDTAFRIAAFCVIVGIIGALTGFLIIIGDLGVPVLRHYFGDDSILASRGLLVAVFCTFFVFPASLTTRMHSMLISNIVAMVSILAVAGVVLWRGASEVAAHGLGDDVHAAVPSATIFLGVPISIFSLGCHTQIVPVAAEMAPRHEHNIGKVVASGTTFCVLLYTATGLGGYLQFGDRTLGDIFSNYGDRNLVVVFTKLIMALHVSMAAPVLMFPCRRCMSYLMLRHTGASTPNTSRQMMALQSGGMLVLTGVMAVLFPQVAVVFGLVGATIAVTQIYLYPGVLLLSLVPSMPSTKHTMKAGGVHHRLPADTAAVLPSGPAHPPRHRGDSGTRAAPKLADLALPQTPDMSKSRTVDGIVDPPLLAAVATDGGDAAASDGEQHVPSRPIEFLPCCTRANHTRLGLQLQGYFLVCTGAVVGVLSTAVIVYLDFVVPDS